MMHEEQEVEITSDQLQSMKMCKIFKDHQKDINAIDFSKDGQYLVSCDDQALNVYDVHQGKKMRTLYNKVKEIDLVRFTHHNSCVLCVTKKEPYDIYYWSLHDNQILKKFTGHTNMQNQIELPILIEYIGQIYHLSQMIFQVVVWMEHQDCGIQHQNTKHLMVYQIQLLKKHFVQLHLIHQDKYLQQCFWNNIIVYQIIGYTYMILKNIILDHFNPKRLIVVKLNVQNLVIQQNK